MWSVNSGTRAHPSHGKTLAFRLDLRFYFYPLGKKDILEQVHVSRWPSRYYPQNGNASGCTQWLFQPLFDHSITF